MSEELKAKVKAIFPEDVEGIYISKNDYDRLYGDMTLENIELKEEIERLNNIINELEEDIKVGFYEYESNDSDYIEGYNDGAEKTSEYFINRIKELKEGIYE